MTGLIRIFRGFYFPKPFRYFGFAGIVFGLVLLGQSILGGLAVTLVSCIVSFTPWGTEIQPGKKFYRTYVSWLGFRKGEWKSTADYPYIAILSGQVSESTYGGKTTASVTTRKNYFDICLLTKTHRQKLAIERADSIEEAKEALSKYAEIFKVQSVNYNPQVSSAAKRRRK